MSEHWYTQDGQAAHTQPTKTKGAKNPTRPTTIVDAKRLFLLPSVSSILKVINNPMLDRWKHGKIVEACFNNPANVKDFENLDDYSKRILDMAFDEASDAADLGTRIHANIEALLKNEPMPHKDETHYALDAIDRVDQLGLKIEASEICLVNGLHGFAGTTDLVFANGEQHGILDFKSRKTKEGEPVTPHFGHAAQIAAYFTARFNESGITDDAVGYNVYISTTEPGRIEVVKYDSQTLKSEFAMFLNACAIWRHKSKYDPRLAKTDLI